MSANDPVGGDPLVSFNFAVMVDGVTNAYFTEASGLGSESEVIEHKVMGKEGKEIVRKIPGRLKWNDINLKRGITANLDIYKWRKQVEDGQVDSARKNGSIAMYDQTGSEVARWDFQRAWPSSLTGPTVGADSNEVGVEEMTLVFEGIERVK